MLLILLLVVAAVAGISSFVLQDARSSLFTDVERRLASRIQAKNALLAVWYGSIADQTRQLADSDTVRLFAYETVSNDYDAAYLLGASREILDTDGIISRPTAALRTGQQQLGSQAPLLHRQFQNFILRFNLVSAAMYNPRHQSYIAAGG